MSNKKNHWYKAKKPKTGQVRREADTPIGQKIPASHFAWCFICKKCMRNDAEFIEHKNSEQHRAKAGNAHDWYQLIGKKSLEAYTQREKKAKNQSLHERGPDPEMEEQWLGDHNPNRINVIPQEERKWAQGKSRSRKN